MRTQGTRWRSALVGLVIVACGHAPPPRVPEPDDDRAGATELVGDAAAQVFSAEGVLDASTGDTVDWYTLTLLPEVKSTFTVWVQGTGRTDRLPLTITVVDGAARSLGRAAVKPEGVVDVAYVPGFVASGRAYIVLTAKPGSGRITYRVTIQDVYGLPPPPPPPCDPRNWDAGNPSCKEVCDFKHPDLRDVKCCSIMRPCAHGIATGSCFGDVKQVVDGTFYVALGRADVGLDFLPARLVLNAPEPPVLDRGGREIRNFDHGRPVLELVSADEHSSTWRLTHSASHDLTWLAANAPAIELEAPGVCRGGDYVPRRP
jgi:hypothetical protein